MFDQLVESTKDKPQGRSKFYLVITAIYGVSIMALGILTVMWFNPMPAEAYERVGIIAPPPPTAPRPIMEEQKIAAAPRNLAPISIPKEFPDPNTIKPSPAVNRKIHIITGGIVTGSNVEIGPPKSFDNQGIDEAPMPVPTPRTTPSPTPRPEPIATPTPKPRIVVSDMLPSKAIKKVQPPYPAIARSARIQGAVTVQVLISEEGRVVSASTVNGHPLLLDASVQAARQWIFTPTTLNGQPVKVSGVLTFNFTLN